MALLHQVWSTGWNEKLMGTDKTIYALFVGLLVFSWCLFCLSVFRGRLIGVWVFFENLY